MTNGKTTAENLDRIERHGRLDQWQIMRDGANRWRRTTAARIERKAAGR